MMLLSFLGCLRPILNHCFNCWFCLLCFSVDEDSY
ncbi:unnamed protein product [Arabidopsis lyrata]|nr:unnamed protein product [Arabidopsis lyrata]